MSDAALKPCPFCRGAAKLTNDSAGGQGRDTKTFVCCAACGARAKAFMDGWEGGEAEVQAKAAAAWNGRAIT